MSDEAEVLYDSRQVAESLGVGSAMLRRYGAIYEQVTGNELPIHRRLGRQFTREQVEVLKVTRDMVQRRGLSVEVAMREALGLTEKLPELERGALGTLSLEEFKEALTASYKAANRELLQELRQENRVKAIEARDAEAVETTDHGAFVRFALWIERRLRGRNHD